MAKDVEPKISVRPTPDEWNKFIGQHLEIVNQEFEKASSSFIRSMNKFMKEISQDTYLQGTLDGGETVKADQKERISLPKMTQLTDNSDDNIYEPKWSSALFEKASSSNRYERPPSQTIIICPPYSWGAPLTPKIIYPIYPDSSLVTPDASGYARSIAFSMPNNGRIELGVSADCSEGVSLVGDLFVSKASAKLGIGETIFPSEPSTLTVHVDVVVDALFNLGSYGAGYLGHPQSAGIKMDLVLTVTKYSMPITTVIKRKCVYDEKWFVGINDEIIYDNSPKSFTISTSLDVNSPGYVIASLSVEAIATATKRYKPMCCTSGMIDAEGFSSPPGELKYRASGSLFVPGFLLKMYPKN
jgi:hypothetical protein